MSLKPFLVYDRKAESYLFLTGSEDADDALIYGYERGDLDEESISAHPLLYLGSGIVDGSSKEDRVAWLKANDWVAEELTYDKAMKLIGRRLRDEMELVVRL